MHTFVYMDISMQIYKHTNVNVNSRMSFCPLLFYVELFLQEIGKIGNHVYPMEENIAWG